jgi:hypothetical protein
MKTIITKINNMKLFNHNPYTGRKIFVGEIDESKITKRHKYVILWNEKVSALSTTYDTREKAERDLRWYPDYYEVGVVYYPTNREAFDMKHTNTAELDNDCFVGWLDNKLKIKTKNGDILLTQKEITNLKRYLD